MHGETDSLRQMRAGLLRALALRRLVLWPLPLLAWCWLAWPGALLWAAWVVLDLMLWRRRLATVWLRWLDAAVPALEDSSALLAGAAQTPVERLQRQRLQIRLLSALGADDYRRIARQRVALPVLAATLCLVTLAALWGWRQSHQRVTELAPRPRAAVAAIADGAIVMQVTPPAYTGVAPFQGAAKELVVPQFSQVRWCVQGAPAGAVAPVIELSDGQVLKSAQPCAEWNATASLFWRWNGAPAGAAAARFNLRVTPDKAPEIAVLAPTDLITTLATAAKGVELSLSARDDYAIVNATLHLTLARGNGENIRFSDREMPLPASSDKRVRSWKKPWTLADLGMEPGDDLYFFVRATDNAPGHPHTTQSATYTLRLPGPESESLDASAQPTLVKQESLRSQRQIIIDTEQLVADIKGAKMSAATQRERSESIAADQAQLRLRYGQFLGEESSLFGESHEHEEAQEAKQKPKSAEAEMIHEFGHSHDQAENATLFDPATKAILRRALMAMWDAEKSLRAVAPAAALPPEYKALAAIKELQQADRIYLHRTSFVPPPLKEEIRMTGDVVGALSYKRAQGTAATVVAAETRDLIQALGGDGPLPALWSRQARAAIEAHVSNDEQRLAAQRAVQDVADGCVPCRAPLRAWLRGAIADAPVLLQATPRGDSKFQQAWSASLGGNLTGKPANGDGGVKGGPGAAAEVRP